jgi:hypothetical protein
MCGAEKRGISHGASTSPSAKAIRSVGSTEDPTLRVPWEDAVLKSGRGIPYLAPELQLLFKSKNNRTKDDRDASEVIPALAAVRQRRLRDLLPHDHPWKVLLVP